MKTTRILLPLLLVLISFIQLFGQNPNPTIKKVHIIFKTHLDVGFTDLSSKVEQRYINDFIPKAIAVAEELKTSGAKERYIWTTGAWLIWSFIEQASPEQVALLEKAIQQGDIIWNGVAYTVQSEAMNKEHFEAILKLSQYLDKRYGKKTIAAKMTDVPGHTRSIVSLMSKAGIHLLHIGVNPASVVPDVPRICRWRDKDGNEIILMYQKDYGSDMILPDGETVMSIAFTGDNHGPHTTQQVKDIYASIQQRYPNAELIASTLSDVANEMEALKELVPIVTTEIGDTWIYGYGSSPLMMARYRAVSRLYAKWIKEKRLDPDNENTLRFAIRLGLVPEHTWGLDVKSYLKHWDIYEIEAFQKARKLPKFELMELSWHEKEAHIDEAIRLLPPQLQAEAKEELAKIGNPVKQVIKQKNVPEEISPDGTLRINYNGINAIAGELVYQTFSKEDFDRFQDSYLTLRAEWSLSDFGKLGIENTTAKSASIKTVLQNCDYKTNTNGKEISCKLVFSDDNHINKQVLPEEIYANYKIDNTKKNIDLDITWINKPANRLPEAYWLSFQPEQITSILVDKLGKPVDVFDVVEGGNRQMHGADRYIDIITTAGRIRIASLDAPLVTIGERNLLNYSTRLPDIQKGIHFCLFNNVWGTNFRMWFGGSITYRFRITLL